MKQNTELRKKPTLVWTVNLQQREWGKDRSSINGVGQLHAKESNWTTFSYHIQK